MPKSTTPLSKLLKELTARARQAGYSDAEWARRAGLPKETLCRLRSRANCDLATLQRLATAVGTHLGLRNDSLNSNLWPNEVDRALESSLVDLLQSGNLRREDWLPLGPPFFLAGVATMMASVPGFERSRCLALAESLHPGASEPRVFQQWLDESPLKPSRFLPMVRTGGVHGA